MALNGTAVAARVGIAVPLVFVLALVGVALVMWGFVRLSRQFSHAGSVYAFSGAHARPARRVLRRLGAARHVLRLHRRLVGRGRPVLRPVPRRRSARSRTPTGSGSRSWPRSWSAWWPTATSGSPPARCSALEVVSVTLIVILMVVIFWKLATDGAPNGQDFTWDVFRLGPHSLSKFGEATVFAFLSWAGFEGAAALGEETDDPGRTIPAAIRRAVLFTGIFYVLCMLAQTLGFGATPAGRRGLRRLAVAARRPRPVLRRLLVLRPDQPRRGDQRLRQRARHGHRRLAHPLRPRPRRLRHAAAGRDVALRLAGQRAGAW